MEYDTDSIVGKGFVFNYAMRVVEKARTATVIMPSSAHWRFDKGDVDFYSLDNNGTLSKQDNKFILNTLDKVSYYFDSNGYLDYIADRYGNQLDFTIDAMGQVQEIKDDSGTNIEFTYTEGLLSAIEEKNGDNVLEKIEYTYNDNGYLVMTKYQNGSEKHYSYANGRLAEITISDKDNTNPIKSLDITYYTDGNYEGMVKSTTNSINVETVYSYDFSTNSTTIEEYTNETSNTETSTNKVRSIKQTYNDKLSIIQVDNLMYSEGNQQVEEIQYDSSVADTDSPSSTTDEYGNTTYYVYDENGNVIKTTYDDESFETSEYNSANLLIKHTDRNGLVTNYEYSDSGLLTSTTTGGILMASYTYYSENIYGIEGLVHKETDARGNITEYVYNNKGNIVKKIQTIDNVNYTTEYEYNTQGWLIKEVDPNGVITEYTHDVMGNVLLTKVSCQADEYERFTRTVYDIFGRVIQEIDSLDYNPALDNLVSGSYSNTEVGVRTQYNTKGQVIKVTDALGNTIEYEYDLDGNVVKEIQANGSYRRYVYDNYGRVKEEYSYDNDTKVEILVKKYTYTEGKNEIKTTEYYDDSYCVSTTELYNFEGNVEKIIYPNGLEENYEYDKGLLIKEQKGENVWTTYTYDSWGRVLTEISSFDSTGNSVKKYTYDNYGNVIRELVKNNAFNQDESYKKTEYTYDSRNNLVATIVYKGKEAVNSTQSYYSWDNKLLREYKGLTEPLVINGLDNIENPLNQEYSVIKYEYDALGRLSKKIDALNKTIEYEYDEENREVKQIDRNGVEHSMTYDRNGNLIKKTSSNNTETIEKTYSYDCMGNMLTEKEGNLLITYVYDAQGNCIKETISNENAESDEDVIKEYTYNNAGMLLTHKITIGNTVKQNVSKVYDDMGNIKKVSDNNSIKATYKYDLFDRVILTEYNNGVIEENTYNYAGLVTSTTNRKDSNTISKYLYTYYYDGQERSKSENGRLSTYVYDEMGQLVKEIVENISDNNTTISNANDISVDIPIIVNVTETNQVRYYSFTPSTTSSYTIESMDNSGDPLAYIYTSNGTTVAQSDDDGSNQNFKVVTTLTAGTKYIIGVKENSGKGSCAIKITQNQSSGNTTLETAKMIDIDFPISININGYYDIRYLSFIPKITGIYTIESSCHTGYPVAYLCSADGTELTQSEGVSDVPYENFKFEYTLTAGTIYTIKTRDFTNVGTYKINITPPEYNETEKVVEYIYDDNGNRTKMTTIKNDEITNTVYTYDKNDRLLSTQNESESIITYTYDNNGNMLSKSDGTTQEFDVLNRMTEFSSSNDITTVYEYYPDDMRKSKKVGTSEKMTQVWLEDEIALDIEGSGTTTTYLHGNKLICGTYGWYLYNAHGDVTALVNDSGAVIQNYEYDAFGVQLNEDDVTNKNPYRYCGEYYDIESGYTYLQARYYDPDIGRFISEDPALDGNNWYVYCGNDPINMIDPTGMWSFDIHRQITSDAFSTVSKVIKNKKKALSELKRGSVYPDKARNKGSLYYKNGRWHGHDGYLGVMKEQLKKAKEKWNNKKYGASCFELGKALHTIQDFYAHNVMHKGEITNSRMVAKGKFYVTNIGERTAFKVFALSNNYNVRNIDQYIGQTFVYNNNSNANCKPIEHNTDVHSVTADNPYAYFDGKKWVCGKGYSSRYKKAINESKKYINKFVSSLSNKKINLKELNL